MTRRLWALRRQPRQRVADALCARPRHHLGQLKSALSDSPRNFAKGFITFVYDYLPTRQACRGAERPLVMLESYGMEKRSLSM